MTLRNVLYSVLVIFLGGFSGCVGTLIALETGTVELIKVKVLQADTIQTEGLQAKNEAGITTTVVGQGVAIMDENEKTIIHLILTDSGNGTLAFYDQNEKERIWLGSHPEYGNKSFVKIMDENGKARAVLGATATLDTDTGERMDYPESTLILYDEKGELIYELPPSQGDANDANAPGNAGE